ncbi:MAG: DUF3786 domain-containing protein [Chloroflexi bacterium]|nr:DUF3786 domain-containing protein [Chloroflexota bacterium]
MGKKMVMEMDQRDEAFRQFIENGREELRTRDPRQLALRTGVEYNEGESYFWLQIFGTDYAVSFPELIAREAATDHHVGSDWVQGLVVHYFRTADGTPLTGKWIAFRELPGGRNYSQAFQGYTGNKLVRALQNDVESFRFSALKFRGKTESMGDAAFSFQLLPRVSLAVVYWLGDDEFPPTSNFLFDSSASHYLPTDGLAVLGGRLCNLLLRGASKELESSGPDH